MSAEQFCVACGVSTDLHPDEEISPFACGTAARKAALIEGVGRAFFRIMDDRDDAGGTER